MISTTLNEIRRNGPCEPSWEKLLKGLDKTAADDEILPLEKILDICGLNDCLWAAIYLPEHDHIWQNFGCDCAERALPAFENIHPDDKKPREIIETVRRFADGAASDKELAAVWDSSHSWNSWASWAADFASWAADWAAYWWSHCQSARVAEREWQKSRLLAYLRGELPNDAADA